MDAEEPPAPTSGPGHEALLRLLDAYAAGNARTRALVEREIWGDFGLTGAPLVLDMSGFSRTVRRRGIVAYLAMVRRMQRLTAPIVARSSGRIVKFEADNLYALFGDVPEALEAASAILEALASEVVADPEDRIRVSMGIAYGSLVLIDGRDYFGDCVNTAAKLGEDLAGPGVVLVSEEAVARLPMATRLTLSPCRFELGGLVFEAAAWSPGAAGSLRSGAPDGDAEGGMA
jgi:class 3 adenylate cyclase